MTHRNINNGNRKLQRTNSMLKIIEHPICTRKLMSNSLMRTQNGQIGYSKMIVISYVLGSITPS